MQREYWMDKSFGNTSFRQKFADKYRLQQRIPRGAVLVVSRSTDIGGKKSAKGTKSHSTSAFLLCQRSLISAGNWQILVAENRASFHWGLRPTNFFTDFYGQTFLKTIPSHCRFWKTWMLFSTPFQTKTVLVTKMWCFVPWSHGADLGPNVRVNHWSPSSPTDFSGSPRALTFVYLFFPITLYNH